MISTEICVIVVGLFWSRLVFCFSLSLTLPSPFPSLLSVGAIAQYFQFAIWWTNIKMLGTHRKRIRIQWTRTKISWKCPKSVARIKCAEIYMELIESVIGAMSNSTKIKRFIWACLSDYKWGFSNKTNKIVHWSIWITTRSRTSTHTQTQINWFKSNLNIRVSILVDIYMFGKLRLNGIWWDLLEKRMRVTRGWRLLMARGREG